MKSLLLAMLPAAMCAGAAFAEEPAPARNVDFETAQLFTEAGRERVESRIREAAAEVCRAPHGVPMSAHIHSEIHRCREQAIASAMTRLKSRVAEVEQDRAIRLAGEPTDS